MKSNRNLRIDAAIAAATASAKSLPPAFPVHAVPKGKPKPKKLFTGRTARFKIARSFRAGHGRLS